MTKIFDARAECAFSNERILFDTNVWIAIEGFDPTGKRPKAYSDFYSSAVKNNNFIVVNDYILSEFFNLCCKLEYELRKKEHLESGTSSEFPNFKVYRRSDDFREFMETVRDTCLNIVDDVSFEPVSGQFDVRKLLTEAGSGSMDFNDLIMREHCLQQGYIVVSHDADFSDCGLAFVTANPRVLREAEKQNKLYRSD